MHLFWWQQLLLLLFILLLLLGPNSINPKTYTEALVISKKIDGYPQQSKGMIKRIWGTYPFRLRTRLLELPSPFAVNFVARSSQIQLQHKHSKSRRIAAATVDGDNDVPTLTSLHEPDVMKPRQQKFAAIVGGIGATLIVILIVVLVCICLMRLKRSIRQTSETASSVPSPPVPERVKTYAGCLSSQNFRHLTILELQHATNNFSQNNIIGQCGFGLVYKGLLQDGSIVAIKRRLHTPIQCLAHEMKNISRVQHKHVVKLVGYCENTHQQILVYDYIPNGNVGYHLYDNEGSTIGRLNMQQRVVIALGAARGLEHLHSLVPPLLHMNFRTNNVLLDESFTAKISDYGLSSLVAEGYRSGSSSRIDSFLDPELTTSKNFTARNDVYSFGVFLLELISGHEVHSRNLLNSEQNLALLVRACGSLINFVDETLGGESMKVAEQILELALKCLDISPNRPLMEGVVEELERIYRGEFGHLNSQFCEGEEIVPVTLGSELFK